MHRVSLATTPTIRHELGSFGIRVGEGFVSFELDEDDERWAALSAKLSPWQAVDLAYTRFTIAELRRAEWLQMLGTWHHGYPQPDEEDFGYLTVSYDSDHRCALCGIGAVQKAPFRMKGEPKWGGRRILQLNWVFDEVYEDVFASLGVASRVVLDSTGTRELETVVQLVAAERVSAVLDGYDGQVCPACGRVKYTPITRGFFPKLQTAPTAHLARTNEYFGSGASAYNAILISQEVFRRLRARSVKGVGFVPVG